MLETVLNTITFSLLSSNPIKTISTGAILYNRSFEISDLRDYWPLSASWKTMTTQNAFLFTDRFVITFFLFCFPSRESPAIVLPVTVIQSRFPTNKPIISLYYTCSRQCRVGFCRKLFSAQWSNWILVLNNILFGIVSDCIAIIICVNRVATQRCMNGWRCMIYERKSSNNIP